MNNKKINTYYVYEEGESEENGFMIEIPNIVNYYNIFNILLIIIFYIRNIFSRFPIT